MIDPNFLNTLQNTQDEMLMSIAATSRKEEQFRVVKNINVPTYILETLFKSPYAVIRKHVMLHTNVSEELLTYGLLDTEESVRKFANQAFLYTIVKTKKGYFGHAYISLATEEKPLEFKNLDKAFEAKEKISKLKGEEFTIFHLNKPINHNLTPSKV